MHGTIMLLLFATPLFVGFANVIMPLQIGSPDVAFPRLNMFSYWLFLFGGLIAMLGFLTPGRRGRVRLVRLRAAELARSTRPGVGGDLWIMGLALAGFGTILGAVNFITTIFCMRAPGMTMFRMPIFTWNILLTSVLVLMAFPVLAAALLALEADRKFGAHVFDPANGGAMLWQHLFWFFGHPEVYIIALPFFGIVSEILPVFSRKPIFGYKGLVFATIAIAGLSVTVWAHHMFPTGAVLLPFFSFMTFLIAVPTGVKFFNWIGTMWRGSLTFETPMLWSIGFLVTFLFGGLTGMILASPPLDLPVSDTYFVVAHFHYVVFGTVVFAMFARLLLLVAEDDRPDARRAARQDPLLDAVHRLPHDVPDPALAGRDRHAAPVRRLPAPATASPTMNMVSTIGSFLLGASTLPFLYNVIKSMQGPEGHHRRPVGLRPLAGVGDVLPAAAAQLPRAAADPLRVARPSTCTTRTSPPWTPRRENKNLLDQALGEPDLEGGTGGERR